MNRVITGTLRLGEGQGFLGSWASDGGGGGATTGPVRVARLRVVHCKEKESRQSLPLFW